MATQIQIAKLALQHVGDRYDINDLSESTTEAEQVNLVYDNMAEQLIREHPWKFSLAYTSPSSLSGTPPANWGYMFTYPAEALRVWKIVDPLGRENPPIPWTVGRNSNGVKVLLTDEQTPEFEYGVMPSNTADFDASFVIALSWRIAQAIAYPLTLDTGLANDVFRRGEIEIAKAKAHDGNEGVEAPQTRGPDWIRARA